MSNVLDKVFTEVCLDDRVSDGIFRMDETEHMNALRDFFLKKGIAKEDVIKVTNRMIEGKYPDRQAYRTEDGILVTWPSPKHKQKAMKENPRKYVDENPFPKKSEPESEPKKKDPFTKDSSEKELPVDDTEDGDSTPIKKTNNLFGDEPENGSKVKQGNKQLSIEPIQGTSISQATTQQPIAPPPQPTPQRIAAEKEITKQIVYTDDSSLTNVANPLTETCRIQLNELYKKAYDLGFTEAVTFLTPYVRPH